jgi:hypothetical protein
MRMLCFCLTLLSVALPHDAFAAPETQILGGPRVRPSDGRTAAIFLDGLRRSPTLRALVEQIETRNVIAHLEIWAGLTKKGIGGRLTWVTAAGQYRYVRIALSPALSGNAAISMLAHELRHVLEVGDDPSIVDDASLTRYYAKHGISVRGGLDWDSESARSVADEVRRDLISARAGRTTESIRDFDPLQWTTIYRRAREEAAAR